MKSENCIKKYSNPDVGDLLLYYPTNQEYQDVGYVTSVEKDDEGKECIEVCWMKHSMVTYEQIHDIKRNWKNSFFIKSRK